MEQSHQYQCACCDYFTLYEPLGSYDICPVCFWEDDPEIEFDKQDKPSPSNHELTLKEARGNFIKIGACNQEMLEHVTPTEERSSYVYKKR